MSVRPRLPVLAAALLGLALSAALATPATAAARTVALSERAHLHLTGSHGLHLDEAGRVSGTIRGAIYIHLNVGSGRSVSAEVNLYPSGGSLSGYGSAAYHVVGGYAQFSGTLSISRGSGPYGHASARDLRFAGSIRRSDDATSVTLSGTLHY